MALTDPAPAVVEDGAMVLRQRANTIEHTFVTSEKKYRNFILELDLKDDPSFNCGILLQCVDAPADAPVRQARCNQFGYPTQEHPPDCGPTRAICSTYGIGRQTRA